MRIYINLFEHAELGKSELPTSVSQSIEGALEDCCYINRFDEYQPREGYISTQVYEIIDSPGLPTAINHIESLDLGDDAQEWADERNEEIRAVPSDYEEHFNQRDFI